MTVVLCPDCDGQGHNCTGPGDGPEWCATCNGTGKIEVEDD